MDYLVICLVALLASGLTLFSGFGLGTLLLPAFALFFPIELAVAATAVVHLLNNLFKLLLVGKHAVARVVVRFGVPALFAALGGAWVLSRLVNLQVLASYELAGRQVEIRAVGLVVGLLILLMALTDLWPRGQRLAFPVSWLPLGGLLSGFFGGLSGHQGALRSAFLIRLGLDKQQFIGSGTVCAVLVDLARLAVYGTAILAGSLQAMQRENAEGLVAAATLMAFAGAWIGARTLGRITLDTLHRLVGVLLVLVGLGLALGLV